MRFFVELWDVSAHQTTCGNLIDAARHWVENYGLLPSSDELPVTESFLGSRGLLAVRYKLLHLYWTCVKESSY